MRSSSRLSTAAGVVAFLLAADARAQQARGFGVERLAPSAPDAGWFVMDDLRIPQELGGAMSLTLGYARDPLVVSDGASRVAVVSNELAGDFQAAITYRRFRAYLGMGLPFVIAGASGTVDGYAFSGPSVNPSSLPDPIADVRIGCDAQLVGEARDPLRFGGSFELFLPNGKEADYQTDGTLRALLRALVAGDTPWFSYAGHLGVHVRPRDDPAAAHGPRGSELVFGVAAGPTLALPELPTWSLRVGPELFGATALESFFGSSGTAFEALASAQLTSERRHDDGPQVRIKLGVGGGIEQHLGAPEWRLLASIEMFGYRR